jgi:uncharacterized protein (DUF1697 family)
VAEYLAFLRGINVGGKTLIKMANLKIALEDAGFHDVRTYIQSGNVFVSTSERSRTKVADTITSTIRDCFALEVPSVVFTKAEWKAVLQASPKWWGQGDGWKHDIFILLPPFKMSEVMTAIGDAKVDIEQMEHGKGVVYSSRLFAKTSSTTAHKVISKPIYKRMTVRNHNTANKLFALFK